MKIAIVEFGGELAKVLQSELSKKMETSTFETKKSLDLFDVLAYARKMIDSDQLVLIAQLNPDEKELNTIFYEGLATLEEETGKNIFKCIYMEDEDGEAKVRELAVTFFNYLFHPEKLNEKKEAEPDVFSV